MQLVHRCQPPSTDPHAAATQLQRRSASLAAELQLWQDKASGQQQRGKAHLALGELLLLLPRAPAGLALLGALRAALLARRGRIDAALLPIVAAQQATCESSCSAARWNRLYVCWQSWGRAVVCLVV